MTKISIVGGRVIDPAQKLDAVTDLHIADGKIIGAGQAPDGFNAEQTIDAHERWVLPALIDASARLREPGLKYRANLDSELHAALKAGIGGLVCPPDTDPPLDEPGLVEMLCHRASQRNGTHLYPQGALTVGLEGEVITEMAQLTEAGCIGFGQPTCLPRNTKTLLRALQYAATFNFTVWLHPQDAWLGEGGVAHGGVLASRLGLAGIPVSTETIALHTIFDLVRQTGASVHLCRLSSAAGVELVRQAKAEGLSVSADVAVNHLHLIDLDIGFFDSRFRLDPPLRSQRDRDALRAGLLDGTVDLVCSDHTPVADENKHLPFAETEPGATAIELLLPLTMKWARDSGASLTDLLASVTSKAARIVGCPGGSLAPDEPADVTLYDPAIEWQVNESSLNSHCQVTPWSGLSLVGRGHVAVMSGRVMPEPTAAQ
ncbi:MAG: dihydroorotase [Burkholderiaceae bacterium]